MRRPFSFQDDGDLLRAETIDFFADVSLNKQKCDFITADGGIDVSEDYQFEHQELYNFKLFFAEMIAAFQIQKSKGHFVMKIYDCYYDLTA